ncbi:MAG: hypothetical protein ACUVRJ_03520, partial [Candidatus Villigracilaceae bacterium]
NAAVWLPLRFGHLAVSRRPSTWQTPIDLTTPNHTGSGHFFSKPTRLGIDTALEAFVAPLPLADDLTMLGICRKP